MFRAGLAGTSVEVVVTDRSKLERSRTLAVGKTQRAETNGYLEPVHLNFLKASKLLNLN